VVRFLITALPHRFGLQRASRQRLPQLRVARDENSQSSAPRLRLAHTVPSIQPRAVNAALCGIRLYRRLELLSCRWVGDLFTLRRWLRDLSRAQLDVLLIVAISIPAYAVLLWTDAFDALYEVTRSHEDWQLDELIVLALVVGIASGLFGFRRLLDLRIEVARREAAEADANSLARHDALTGLPNRRQFLDQASREFSKLAADQAMAILLVDLDRFKPVNDLYGHGVGDAVLCEVAARMSKAVESHGVVARLGGDEFGILVPEMAAGTAERIARRIVHDVAQPIAVGALSIGVGASVGITLASRRQADGAEVQPIAEEFQQHLRHADLAMYRAKIEGRGQYRFFEHSMDEQLKLHLRLESELAHAIAAGQIVPYYQPLVALNSNDVIGYEVLARWLHPALGVVSPEDFIPIAEDTGLIRNVTIAILSKAVEDVRRWPAHVYLSVNISPRQLSDAWLAQEILGILSRSGFPPARLEVEITESGLVENVAEVKQVLASLRNVGIRIALDDFGTGYSSLYHLRALSIDTIKIDRSFVTHMLANPEEEQIVEAVIRLSNAMGIRTVAEGIETPEVLTRLQKIGCNIGQRYYFGKPQPIDETADGSITTLPEAEPGPRQKQRV
jgi:diguanylate cyclase (GGDEF)-like protein